MRAGNRFEGRLLFDFGALLRRREEKLVETKILKTLQRKEELLWPSFRGHERMHFRT